MITRIRTEIKSRLSEKVGGVPAGQIESRTKRFIGDLNQGISFCTKQIEQREEDLNLPNLRVEQRRLNDKIKSIKAKLKKDPDSRALQDERYDRERDRTRVSDEIDEKRVDEKLVFFEGFLNYLEQAKAEIDGLDARIEGYEGQRRDSSTRAAISVLIYAEHSQAILGRLTLQIPGKGGR